jgi:hypothetical protein
VKNKKPRGRQNLLDNCQPYGIPAFAGMTEKSDLGFFTDSSNLPTRMFGQRLGQHQEMPSLKFEMGNFKG